MTETLAEATLDQQLFIVEAAHTGEALLYGYLWSHESDAGREDPAKRCVVVLAVGDGAFPRVVVAPITSGDPADLTAIALVPGVIGLVARHGRGGVRDGPEGVAGVGVGDEGGGVG